MNDTANIIENLLTQAGLNARVEGDFIYLEDPACITRGFENFLTNAWTVLALATVGLIFVWGLAMIRGAKNNIMDNIKNLILILGIMTAVGPILNMIYGGDLFGAGCKEMKVSIDNVKEILEMRIQAENASVSNNENVGGSGPVTKASRKFSDGLVNLTNVKRNAPNEFGAGITEISEYAYDINQDGRPDKIIRLRQENGTERFQYVYKILLNNGTGLVDITPKDFFTIEDAECALQKIQFSFEPDFSVTKISRPLGDDWYTPTRSTKTVYSLWANKMRTISEIDYKTVCDVSELF